MSERSYWESIKRFLGENTPDILGLPAEGFYLRNNLGEFAVNEGYDKFIYSNKVIHAYTSGLLEYY